MGLSAGTAGSTPRQRQADTAGGSPPGLVLGLPNPQLLISGNVAFFLTSLVVSARLLYVLVMIRVSPLETIYVE